MNWSKVTWTTWPRRQAAHVDLHRHLCGAGSTNRLACGTGRLRPVGALGELLQRAAARRADPLGAEDEATVLVDPRPGELGRVDVGRDGALWITSAALGGSALKPSAFQSGRTSAC